MNWHRFDRQSGVLLLEVQVQPGARSEGISVLGDDALKIRLLAKPVDGAANAALAALIADRLGVAKSRVTIVRGASSRRKRVEIRVAEFEPGRLLASG